MNYNDTVDAMFTLAHEMGHAMHSFFSNKTQPYPKSHYSIFVAEVASTLNEALLLDMMLKDPAHANRRAYLLNRSIDNTFGTFFNQTMYARFELFTHETIEKGGALTADSMTEKWLELSSQYYGPALDTSDKAAGYKWARIPHFYNAFYVYQYATSYAASQAIAEMITGGDTTIIPRYLKLLSSGGRTHPIDLLKECGVDMTTSAAVDATIRRFDQQVTELAKIAGVTV
jgi:oligoendopeptidase F